jgi:hypothetical protein
MRTLTVLFIVSLAAASCDDKSQSTDQPPARSDETAPEKPSEEPSSESATDGWTRLEPSRLTDEQKAQLEKATEAQGALGKTLVTALTTSVQADGFAESVEFCRGEAPGIAEKVATKHGVQIGRTSHRLRNPENRGPEWAAPLVEEKVEQRTLLAGPEGELGVFSPITMAELCVNCHGPEEKLADGVAAALEKQYPRDEATGFEAGDLRGWFWVEVPRS